MTSKDYKGFTRNEKHNKKYNYSNNNIDRNNHTYLDYLSCMHKNPNCNVWQLDFLGTIKSDSKSILSFILINIHFTIIDIIKNTCKNLKFNILIRRGIYIFFTINGCNFTIIIFSTNSYLKLISYFKSINHITNRTNSFKI